VAIVAGCADRAFLGRAIRYLAGEEGIRQFLDIGTGLPTADNTHEVAQRVAPEARIVYADNDPLVLTHARALLTSTPEGACDYVEGDLREPDKILAQAARTLDFAKPVALILLGILHHIPDTGQAHSIVRHLVTALAPGSFLRRSQCRGQPHLIGQLAQQHRPGLPHQSLAVAGHIQRMVPPRIVCHEERSCLRKSRECGYRVISQNRGALRRPDRSRRRRSRRGTGRPPKAGQ
jgi:O-methyltransferase involved in polyketide biosynthesis